MGAAGGRALSARAAIGGRAPGRWVSVRAGAAERAVRLRSEATAVSEAAVLPLARPSVLGGREAAIPFSG